MSEIPSLRERVEDQAGKAAGPTKANNLLSDKRSRVLGYIYRCVAILDTAVRQRLTNKVSYMNII